MLTEFHIGIDDTDSLRGGCTTYTAALLFDELCKNGVKPLDFPWLVRLNPNIPWKTRGNGAVSIHLLIDEGSIEELIQIAVDAVRRTSDLEAPRTDPSLAFLKGQVSPTLEQFSRRTLIDVVSVREAERVAERSGVALKRLKGTRGIVGAVAAIGAQLDIVDCTFEILAYRSAERLGKPREVDSESVRKMNSVYGDSTFHNIDDETGRILIYSHGPDPVLFGIRGNSPVCLVTAFRQVRTLETIERVMIFRTNQGTDAHIKEIATSDSVKPYQSVVLNGRVETIPQILRGGHVLFRISDIRGSIDCLAFEPSGSLNKASRELLPGDRVRVSGGARLRSTGTLSLNLERLEIVSLSQAFREENPNCPQCGGRCESMGRGQEFRCKKCGLRPIRGTKNRIRIERKMNPTYIPPPRSRRHLTMPNERRVLNGTRNSIVRSELSRLLEEIQSDNFLRRSVDVATTSQNF